MLSLTRESLQSKEAEQQNEGSVITPNIKPLTKEKEPQSKSE